MKRFQQCEPHQRGRGRLPAGARLDQRPQAERTQRHAVQTVRLDRRRLLAPKIGQIRPQQPDPAWRRQIFQPIPAR
jgi:hypothetical protein